MSTGVLVIARNDDPHVPLITTALTDLGRSYAVLPIGMDRTHYRVSGAFPSLTLDADGRRFRPAEFARVLYLPMAVNRPPQVACDGDAFSAREWTSVLESLLMMWAHQQPDAWLIRPGAEILQDRKLALLAKSVEAGLLLPSTLVSNLVTEADLEPLGGRVIAKAINAWQEIRPGQFFNTTDLTKPARRRITEAGQLATPALLQSFVEHEAEYRCYCVDGEMLMVLLDIAPDAVDARLPGSVTDVRLVDDQPELARKLLDLTTGLGLSYCCYDVLADSGGQHWVTDVNPVGSWAYLRAEHGFDLTPRILRGWLREQS
jgi:hypothetical protein